MHKTAKELSDISAELRFVALDVDNQNIKQKLVKIAQDVGDFGLNYLQPEMTGGLDMMGQEEPAPAATEEAPTPSKFGIDQEQQRYYKVNVEFLYISASDNLQARKKIQQALESIPEFEGKFNVGEAQGQSVKEAK